MKVSVFFDYNCVGHREFIKEYYLLHHDNAPVYTSPLVFCLSRRICRTWLPANFPGPKTENTNCYDRVDEMLDELKLIPKRKHQKCFEDSRRNVATGVLYCEGGKRFLEKIKNFFLNTLLMFTASCFNPTICC